MPSRLSIAALTRRATASVRSFSFVPPAPFTPSSSPPCPGSMAIVLIAETGAPSADKSGAGATGWRGAATGRLLIGLRRHQVDRHPRRRVELLRRGPKRPESRAEVDDQRGRFHHANRLHQGLRLNRREHDVERVGVELDRQRIALLCHGAAGARGRVDDQARRVAAFVADRHARDAEVADDQQPRRLAEIEARIVDERERPVDEFTGTITRRPDRVGEAGSETSRPAIDTSG